MSEFVLPFKVAANNVVYVHEEGINAQDVEVELVVLTDGPIVYIWQGRLEVGAAAAGPTNQPPDYDLAARANYAPKAIMGVGVYTVFSVNNAEGFLKVREL